MTRKDYVRIVEDIAVAVNQAVGNHDVTAEQARAVASHFAYAFAYSERQINPRFDQLRFFAAVSAATGAKVV